MHLKHLCYAVGITAHIMMVESLPIAGPNGSEVSGRASIGERGNVFARSPEDVVPVEECKRALHAASILDEALYRRCAGEGEGEGEEESRGDGGTEEGGNDDTGGNDDDGGDIDNAQTASNSPRQDCILTQMGLFPMPNFGLCESLPDTLPTPNPAPPVTPVLAPVTPQPQPEPAPAPAPAPALAPPPARKPVPVDAGGPARAIPKRAVEDRVLEGVKA